MKNLISIIVAIGMVALVCAYDLYQRMRVTEARARECEARMLFEIDASTAIVQEYRDAFTEARALMEEIGPNSSTHFYDIINDGTWQRDTSRLNYLRDWSCAVAGTLLRLDMIRHRRAKHLTQLETDLADARFHDRWSVPLRPFNLTTEQGHSDEEAVRAQADAIYQKMTTFLSRVGAALPSDQKSLRTPAPPSTAQP